MIELVCLHTIVIIFIKVSLAYNNATCVDISQHQPTNYYGFEE